MPPAPSTRRRRRWSARATIPPGPPRRGDDAALRDAAQRILRATPEARLVLLDAQDRARQVHPPGPPAAARDLARLPGLDEHRRGAPGPLLATATAGAAEPLVLATARLEDERGRHAGMAAILLPARALLPRDIPSSIGIDIHLADGTRLASSHAAAAPQDDAGRQRARSFPATSRRRSGSTSTSPTARASPRPMPPPLPRTTRAGGASR